MRKTLVIEEASVEARSAVLKRELGLPDLVFTQILFIVGLLFAAKISSLIVVTNVIGLAIFLGKKRLN